MKGNSNFTPKSFIESFGLFKFLKNITWGIKFTSKNSYSVKSIIKKMFNIVNNDNSIPIWKKKRTTTQDDLKNKELFKTSG